jgi:hypothetical protein
MGGSNSKTVESTTKIHETDIQSEISIEVSNSNKTLTKIANESITNVSSSMVNNATADISSTNIASNEADIGDVFGDGTSKIDISQSAKVDAVTKAAISITSDSSSINSLANQVQNDLNAKMKNSAEASGALETLALTKQAQSDSGGIEKMLGCVMDSVNKSIADLAGSEKKSESREEFKTRVKNNLKMKIANINEVSTDLSNKIVNNISNNIQNNTGASCKAVSTANNKLRIKSITATDAAQVKFAQDAVVKSAINCLITVGNASKAITDNSNTSMFTQKTDTDNAAKADSLSKASGTTEAEKKTTDMTSNLADKAAKVADKALDVGGNIAQTAISSGTMIILAVVVVGGLVLVLFLPQILKAFTGAGGTFKVPKKPSLKMPSLPQPIISNIPQVPKVQ